MGRNRNKNTATIKKVGVWNLKFTQSQAQSFWKLFGSRLSQQISESVFINAARKGGLVIERNLQANVIRDPSTLIHIYLYGSEYFEMGLHNKQILLVRHEEVDTNGTTEIEWIEKMLNLVYEE